MRGTNAEQARYWTEEGGPNWVREESSFDTMLAPFNDALVEALSPQAGELVLDVGCGFGTTALSVASHGTRVHGVDISPAMIARARDRAEMLAADATFAVGDVQTDPLGGPYDAVVSRFGVMFFADPMAAFRNLASATRPGGRLAFVCWQPIDRNPWMLAPVQVLRQLIDDPPPPPPAGVGPFAFGDPTYVERVLTDAGWSGSSIESFETTARLGGNDGVPGAVDQVLATTAARALLVNAGEDLRQRAAAALTERFEAVSVDGVVGLPAAAWLVTARR